MNDHEREQKIEELLTRGVAEVIDFGHLKKRLLAGERLRVKLGIDPTSPNLHLGRMVPLLKLRDFQDLDCEVHFIIGDFTGIIGDTSDKEAERPMLTHAQVEENMKSYLEQAYKILDPEKTETHHNSEWLTKLGFAEIGRMADAFSLAEFNARENIKKRLDAGRRVSFRESMYPLMQGYDSVAVKADVELGGTDQRFNLLAGRHIQPLYDQEAQDILMTNLILGTDGRKMSSSWGNTINLTDAPEAMFKKVMDIPDDVIESYFIHCTRVPMDKVQKMMEGNPREAKFALATDIVTRFHGETAASEARERYETVSEGRVPENVRLSTAAPESTLTDFLVAENLATSKSDARRKIEQGGVSIDGEKITDPTRILDGKDNGKIVKVGKNDFVKIAF